jgi:hypothetical protein
MSYHVIAAIIPENSDFGLVLNITRRMNAFFFVISSIFGYLK